MAEFEGACGYWAMDLPRLIWVRFWPRRSACIAACRPSSGIGGVARGKIWLARGEEDALPFPDAFFDRVMMVHGLEKAEAMRPLMRQFWRVLAPEGSLLLVVPNRASLWAQVERSPFGHGRPFNRRELDRF